MDTRAVMRFALIWLAFIATQLGVWALFAPQSFYDDFPGFGRSWVSVDGPFNEHLVRDVGALNLALAAITIYAIVRLTRDLVVVAAIGHLVWGIAHLVYHLFNTEGLSAVDNVFSLGGLALSVAFAVLLLVGAARLDSPTPEVHHVHV